MIVTGKPLLQFPDDPDDLGSSEGAHTSTKFVGGTGGRHRVPISDRLGEAQQSEQVGFPGRWPETQGRIRVPIARAVR